MKIGRYIIGLMSGLTFGMLFAPKKGSDLRREMSKKCEKGGAESLKVLGSALLDAGEDAVNEIKNLSESEQIEVFLKNSEDKWQAMFDLLEERGFDKAASLQEKLEEFAKFVADKAGDIRDKAIKQKNTVKSEIKGNVVFAKKKLSVAKKKIITTKKKVVKKISKTTGKKK